MEFLRRCSVWPITLAPATHARWPRSRIIFAFTILTLLSMAVELDAAARCVHFDVPQLVACRPVASIDGVDSSHDRFVEASFDVSTLLRFGQESQVMQLLFVIESPAGSLRVVDYSPRTELTSLYVGHVERQQTRENGDQVGLSASFSPSSLISAKANASRDSTSKDSVRFEVLPPRKLLAASGTISRSSAVYFKFTSTPQTTLDGSRQVRVVFRVPTTWRADYVYLRCAAFKVSERQHSPICGSTDFLVLLHQEGDELAIEAARRMARSESELRRLARKLRFTDKSSPDRSLRDKLKAVFSEPTPRIPRYWLTTVLTSSPDQREFSFQNELPDALNQALSQFARDRRQLARLND